MEITDLTGLSKPLTKLIEVFANGCKWVTEPYQIKRIAKANAYASSIKFKEELKQKIVTSLFEHAKPSIREYKEIYNLINILDFAIQEMNSIGNVNDIPVSTEWSARFFDYSQDVCDEEVQVIWAKILAHETANPGTYFKRTLYVLHNIERFEAEWFVELCSFVLNGSFIPLTSIASNRFAFNKFQSMIDCGLANASECMYELDTHQIIEFKTHYLKCLDSHKLQKQIQIKGFTLTDSGTQLYGITQVSSNLDFIQEIKDQIKSQYNIDYEIKD